MWYGLSGYIQPDDELVQETNYVIPTRWLAFLLARIMRHWWAVSVVEVHHASGFRGEYLSYCGEVDK
jgi:hypothetical protein